MLDETVSGFFIQKSGIDSGKKTGVILCKYLVGGQKNVRLNQ